MNNQKLYQIGLTMINGVGDILSRQLLQVIGDPEAIFKEKISNLERISGIGRITAAEIKRSDVLLRAEKELLFIEKNHISCHFFTDDSYAFRLQQCPDAPILYYTKGNIDLEKKKVVSIVGTRKSTPYGKELTEQLIKELAELLPDTLIVSGLAYGIDITSHIHALNNQLPTVAVLAHGLDRIYPYTHRSVAVRMLEQGGLLTEFPSETNPDKPNFVKRNRIVAGLADATVVIESAVKGGSLITADIAFSYGRDVFAFPGKVSDIHSQGCNHLIRQNKAALITSAKELIEAMCWDTVTSKVSEAQQRSLFLEDEKGSDILKQLEQDGAMHINLLVQRLKIPVYELSSLLFELEMSGYIQVLPGNIYQLK